MVRMNQTGEKAKAVIDPCYLSGVKAGDPVGCVLREQQPPVRPPGAAAAGSTPPGEARRAAATQKKRKAGERAAARASGERDGRGQWQPRRRARGKKGSRRRAGCGGPDTSWKLLEMAPATAPEGTASPWSRFVPAELSSLCARGPGALSLRSAVGSG
ncbi:hypothetical protein ACRRTK_024959 [Alexandromys fortis]